MGFWDEVDKSEAELRAKWDREGRRDYESGGVAKAFGMLTLMLIGAIAFIFTWPAVPFIAIMWMGTGIYWLILAVKFGRKREEPVAPPVKKRGFTASERRQQRLAAARAEKATERKRNGQG